MFLTSSFLQIPPHDGHPCFRLYPSHYRADSGLTPVRNVRRRAHYKNKATIPVFLLPTIVAFYVQNFVYVPSLSSPLLLRNYPNTFAFIPIPSMSLSSRNRSISKIFRHILPCIAPVCEGMHYHKTGVP